MLRNFNLGIVVAAALAAPGLAGGLQAPTTGEVIVAPAPAPAPASDWTGFYAGASLSNYSFDEEGLEDDTRSLSVFAGYLHDFGTLVAGAEVYYSDMSDYQDDFAGEEDSEFGLRARLGYDLGRVLPYATVGVSNFESTAYTERDTYFGYGLGAEVQVTDRIRIGAEYYQGQNDEFMPADGPFEIDTRRVSLRAAINF